MIDLLNLPGLSEYSKEIISTLSDQERSWFIVNLINAETDRLKDNANWLAANTWFDLSTNNDDIWWLFDPTKGGKDATD